MRYLLIFTVVILAAQGCTQVDQGGYEVASNEVDSMEVDSVQQPFDPFERYVEQLKYSYVTEDSVEWLPGGSNKLPAMFTTKALRTKVTIINDSLEEVWSRYFVKGELVIDLKFEGAREYLLLFSDTTGIFRIDKRKRPLRTQVP